MEVFAEQWSESIFYPSQQNQIGWEIASYLSILLTTFFREDKQKKKEEKWHNSLVSAFAFGSKGQQF